MRSVLAVRWRNAVEPVRFHRLTLFVALIWIVSIIGVGLLLKVGA